MKKLRVVMEVSIYAEIDEKCLEEYGLGSERLREVLNSYFKQNLSVFSSSVHLTTLNVEDATIV